MIIPCKVGGVVTIGYEGENNAREYFFDITRYQMAWPNGSPQMLVTRSDGENYIAETSVEGASLVWRIKNSDLACPGEGSMIVAFVNDQQELLGYSEKTTIFVEESPSWMNSDDPPPAYEPWIVSILLAGDAAKTGAAEALQSAQAASLSESNAEQSKDAAANSEAAAAESARIASQKAEEAANSAASASRDAATIAQNISTAVSSATAAEQYKNAAAASATAAAASEASASASATAAASFSASTQTAKTSAETAASQALNSRTVSESAANAAIAAKDSALSHKNDAEAAASAAKSSETAANASEDSAKASEEAAKASEGAAKNSENAAKASEDAAAESAKQAAAEVQNIKDHVSEINAAGKTQVSAVTNAGATQVDEVNAAAAQQLSAIDNRTANSLASIPEDYTALYNRAVRNTDTKADAILDTSAKAASHTLHAQDAPMHVTLYGQTYQTGRGDPSPDNVRPIEGVGYVHFRFDGSESWNLSSLVVDGYSNFYISDNRISAVRTDLICDTFRRGTYAEWTGLVQDEFVEVTTRAIGIRVKAERASDLSTWKAWLASNPVNVWTQVARGVPVDSVAVGVSAGDARSAIGMPLPNGEALYGDGTVMDTVENDVPSGCDKWVILNGAQLGANGLTMNDHQIAYINMASDMSVGANAFCDRFPAIPVYGKNVAGVYINSATQISVSVPKETLLAGDYGYDGTINTAHKAISAYLAANPLKVYYRSTKYTPENDSRVCKVTRRTRCATLDGSKVKSASWPSVAGYTPFYYPKFADWVASGKYNNPSNIGYWVSDIWSKSGSEQLGNIYTNADTSGFSFTLPEGTTLEEARAIVDGKKFVYELKTPEVYYADHVECRKPAGLMPVTVTGSGETEVAYAHDTKHYIDSQIAAVVALAMNG